MSNLDILRSEMVHRAALDLKLNSALCEYQAACLDGCIDKNSRDKAHVILDTLLDCLGIQAHCSIKILNGEP